MKKTITSNQGAFAGLFSAIFGLAMLYYPCFGIVFECHGYCLHLFLDRIVQTSFNRSDPLKSLVLPGTKN